MGQYRGQHSDRVATQTVYLELRKILHRRCRCLGMPALEKPEAEIPYLLFADSDHGPAAFWGTVGCVDYKPLDNPAQS